MGQRMRTIIVRTPAIRSHVPPEKKEPRWITFTISVVSFVISVVSFFFSTLLETDHVRLVFEQTPAVYIDALSGDLDVDGKLELAVVNSGNRPASVMRVGGGARRATASEGSEAKCPTNIFEGIGIGFGIEPFALTPGDIKNLQSKTFSGATISPNKDDKDTYTIKKKDFSPKVGDAVIVCVSIDLVTPDELIVWKRPVLKYVFENDANFGFSVTEKRLFESEKPVELVNRNTWFGKLTSIFKQ
jgi:hypothetical protein